MKLQCFRLSDEQLAYLRKEYKDLDEQIKNGELQGKFRLVAQQEALLMMYKLHQIEVERLKKLGDNLDLINFVQGNKE